MTRRLDDDRQASGALRLILTNSSAQSDARGDQGQGKTAGFQVELATDNLILLDRFAAGTNTLARPDTKKGNDAEGAGSSTGGGARGAYQAGVLKRLGEIKRVQANGNPFPIVGGASAGAVNGSALAAGSKPDYLTSHQSSGRLVG